MSPPRDLLSEFLKSAHKAVSNELFGNQFCKLSKNANRRGMIEILMELPEVNNLVIKKYHHAKDDDLAENIYENFLACNQIEENQKMILLTEALFASNYRSKIFLKVLMELARTWYKLGKFSKSLKYCQYLGTLEDILSQFGFYEEYRIEFLLIESECYKKMNLDNKFKLCLNEAMKRVNDLIRKKCETGEEDIFRKEKNCFLQPIFERLNVLKNGIKKDPVAGYFDNLMKKGVKIPIVEGKPNEKLKACSNAISLGYSSTKGRYLFATRRIKAGSVLIVDQPFSFSTDKEAFERNCLNCHTSLKLEDNIRIPCIHCQTVSYCSDTCRRNSWKQYHKFECSIFNYFFNSESQEDCRQKSDLLSYRTTISKTLVESNVIDCDFLRYYSLDGKPEEATLKIGSEIYDPLDYKTVYSLETNCAQINPKENLLLALRSIFLAKLLEFVLKDINPEIFIDQRQRILLAVGTFRHMQAIGCNAYEIVENVKNEESKVYDPRNIGGAIYTSVSLSNHSCYPNVVRHSYPQGVIVVTAIRSIEKGAEILDCYGPHFLKDEKNSRRETLMKKYHFLCNCEACTFDWTLPLSDEIRFKCSCSNSNLTTDSRKCSKCGKRIDCKKIYRHLEESKKKRLNALSKMYNGNHIEALPILLDHSNFVEEHLLEPNLETIKTQQSIIQCLNSMACTSVE